MCIGVLSYILGGIESGVVYASNVQEKEVEPRVVLIATTTTKVIEEKKIPAELLMIGDCESGNRYSDGSPVLGSARQFLPDGSVVKNPHSSATGKYQIMLSWHKATADSLGYDLFTEEGNEDYALWLYEKEGAVPWLASVSCHGIY